MWGDLAELTRLSGRLDLSSDGDRVGQHRPSRIALPRGSWRETMFVSSILSGLPTILSRTTVRSRSQISIAAIVVES